MCKNVNAFVTVMPLAKGNKDSKQQFLFFFIAKINLKREKNGFEHEMKMTKEKCTFLLFYASAFHIFHLSHLVCIFP